MVHVRLQLWSVKEEDTFGPVGLARRGPFQHPSTTRA
nr:hypothetical protein Itr_chr06CG03910 [Ipomoea trifida]GMD02932.1 hypothetical protein Iba_chr06aCG4040 [Ipomoea batatas]